MVVSSGAWYGVAGARCGMGCGVWVVWVVWWVACGRLRETDGGSLAAGGWWMIRCQGWALGGWWVGGGRQVGERVGEGSIRDWWVGRVGTR